MKEFTPETMMKDELLKIYTKMLESKKLMKDDLQSAITEYNKLAFLSQGLLASAYEFHNRKDTFNEEVTFTAMLIMNISLRLFHHFLAQYIYLFSLHKNLSPSSILPRELYRESNNQTSETIKESILENLSKSIKQLEIFNNILLGIVTTTDENKKQLYFEKWNKINEFFMMFEKPIMEEYEVIEKWLEKFV
jgi:hypothetical protein